MIDLLILLIAAVIAHGTSNRREASIEETEYFAEVVAQPNWQITIKEAEFCSRTTDHCSKTGCCKTIGCKCGFFESRCCLLENICTAISEANADATAAQQ